MAYLCHNNSLNECMGTEKSVSDKDLLLNIANKDYNSFSVLYKRYSALFVQWCYIRTKNMDVAKDVNQIFWTKIWQEPLTFKTDENGCGRKHFIQLLTFRIIDYLRSVEGRTASSLPNSIDKVDDLDVSYTHVTEEFEMSELKAIVVEALLQLPELTRRVFDCRWNKNLSVKKTAEELGVSENMVKVRYKDAKVHLRKVLLQQYNSLKDSPENTQVVLLMIALNMNIHIMGFPESLMVV